MVIIDENKCVGCSLCVSDCVMKCISLENGKAVSESGCISCGHCVAICPEAAVTIPDLDMSGVQEYDEKNFSLDPKIFINAIKFRRSVRDFEKKDVEEDKLSLIIEAGRYTPTACNFQDVRFVIVKDKLDEAKQLIWEGWKRYAESLKESDKKRSDVFIEYYNRHMANPLEDRLFFNAPILVAIACDYPINGSLAACNMEMAAYALGLGALYNGFITYALENSAEAREWLGISNKKIITTLLLGYSAVKYSRTAPRKPADIVRR